jgi:hypothetical protein
VKTGEVSGECLPKHRANIRFLKKIDRIVAKSLDLHAIRDNAQDQGSAGVAGQASALPAALHSDLVILAEPRRAAVR